MLNHKMKKLPILKKFTNVSAIIDMTFFFKYYVRVNLISECTYNPKTLVNPEYLHINIHKCVSLF